MATKRKSQYWALPLDKCEGKSLKSGEEFDRKMVGMYYGSSLEYGEVCTPQILNAGDLVAPAYSDLRETFKPKHPYGTFGALLADEEQDQYQLEIKRQVVELPNVESVKEVSDSLSSATIVHSIEELGLYYDCKDGRRISYKEAVQLQASFRSHNDQIQRSIDELVSARGYAPTRVDGKLLYKKFPDSLLSEIADLAKQKKAITGFNLRVSVVGKHTIGIKDNYVECNSSPEEYQELIKRVNYKRKGSYLQGTVRAGTVIIPIQTKNQLKAVIAALKRTELEFQSNLWNSRVRSSYIQLDRISTGQD